MGRSSQKETHLPKKTMNFQGGDLLISGRVQERGFRSGGIFFIHINTYTVIYCYLGDSVQPVDGHFIWRFIHHEWCIACNISTGWPDGLPIKSWLGELFLKSCRNWPIEGDDNITWNLKVQSQAVLVIGRCFNNPAHKTIHLQKVSRQFTCIYMFLLESSKKPFTGPCKRAQNLHPFWTLTCFFRKMYGTFQRLGFSQNDAKTLICCMPFQLFRVPSRKHWARWNSVLAAGSFLPERGSCPPKSKNPRISVQNLSISRFQVGLLHSICSTR